jgi:KDO2-lipid IV(A) lauroyltransferase
MLKTLIDIFSLSVIWVVVNLIRFLPYPLALGIANGCILLLRLLMPRITSVARTNLKIAFPELTEQERTKILHDSFKVLARNIINYARIPDFTTEKSARLFKLDDYKAFYDKTFSKNPDVGIIIATLHYGSFELLAQAVALNVRPASCLIRPFGLPFLDAWWSKRRTMYGSELFSRNGGYNELIARLKNKETVAVLFDQNVKLNHAVFVDFFGIKTATTKALALASIRTGAPIILLAAADLGRDKFEAVCQEITAPGSLSGTLEEKIIALSTELNAVTEMAIRKHPEQWFWIHRRFKTRPEGDTRKLYG